jgi:hypothetical protein
VERTYTYAVSYLRDRDEAWVERFLDDLDRRLATVPSVRFQRWPGGGAGPGGASPGVAAADAVLVLCSPGYFTEGPAEADWAVLAHRSDLGRARGGAAAWVLPLLWEPLAQRLPGPVAEADTFTDRQPPEYRALGLALMTMQAARHRAALSRTLDDLARRLVALAAEGRPPGQDGPAGPGTAPGAFLADGSPRTSGLGGPAGPAGPDGSDGSDGSAAGVTGALPRALASDDARFTTLFREFARAGAATGPAPARRVSWLAAGERHSGPAAGLPAAGRRLVLVGPAGSGRSVQLHALCRQAHAEPGTDGVHGAADGTAPWGCRVAFLVPAADGALPPLDGLVAVVAPALTGQEPAGWAARQLHDGAALLAIDGLDRAPAHRRAAAWEWLRRIAEAHPRAPLVVESNGTSVPWHRLPGLFAQVSLEPPARRDRPAPPAPEGTVRDRLLDGAATWPAAAAAVAAARRSAGPSGPARTDVLRVAVTAAWRPEREDTPARLRVRDSVLRAAAGGLAAATLDPGEPLPLRDGTPGRNAPRQGRGGTPGRNEPLPGPPDAPGWDAPRVDRAAALELLDSLRADGSAVLSPDRLLAELADRAGLLYAPEPGTVAFPHSSIRLFLAAEHLAARPGPRTDRLIAAYGARTGSPELARLVAELADHRPGRRAPALLEHAAAGRRLAAEPLPPPAPAPRGREEVHTGEALRLLAGRASVTELWCHGPLDGLEDALAALPGLRTLVVVGHPGLAEVPDLTGCRSLRTVRLLDCPALRDVGAVARSGVVFLTVDPCREDLDVAPLGTARWLRRVDLVAPRARPGSAPRTTAAGRAEVRAYGPPPRAGDLTGRYG